MKTLSTITVLLFLFMSSAFVPNYESIVQKPTFEVYSIHDLEVKPGVDLKEFETFVMDELAPIYNKMDGQKLVLIKGDRGNRIDKYAIMLVFESIEDRNKIYPPSGGLVGDFGGEDIWNKFDSMVSSGLGENHTDYVKVAP